MQRLQAKLARLNAHSERLLDEMSLAGDHVLARPPVSGAWTPLQALHHVQLVERTSVDYLRYKLEQGAAPPPLTLRARARGKLLRAVMASPLKFQAPQKVDSRHVPGRTKRLSLDELAFTLRSTRQELQELLERMPPDWRRGAVYRHAMGGRMSLGDMMGFFAVHHARHAKQIRRALAQNTRNYRRQKAG